VRFRCSAGQHVPALRPRSQPCSLLLVGSLVVAVALPAVAGAQGPAGPPGPPPGNGGDLPAPPGTAPAFVPPGTPAAVPTATSPGLLRAGDVAFNRAKRSFSVGLACQRNGTLSVTAPTAGRGTLARSRYECFGSSGTARLVVSRKVARQIVRKKTVAAKGTVKQGGRTAKLYFTLRAGGSPPPKKVFWTDGHLQCSPDGSGTPQAYLVEPDFTTSSPTPISTRGWVAWYTAAGGWHWLGVSGENASRWDTWTATATGVAQFHPNGTVQPVPWTWGPISVPSGQGIYAVGVYEIVYWVGGNPNYRWQYVNAGDTGAAAAGAGTLYCVYP
jgi:hypothetical protein